MSKVCELKMKEANGRPVLLVIDWGNFRISNAPSGPGVSCQVSVWCPYCGCIHHHGMLDNDFFSHRVAHCIEKHEATKHGYYLYAGKDYRTALRAYKNNCKQEENQQ